MSELKETVEEKLERLTARDAAEAANEVVLYLTREQALALRSMVILRSGAFMSTDRERAEFDALYGLLTDALRAKGMVS